MKIVFFEVEEWERDVLAQKFPDATFVEGPLTPETASAFPDAEIVSVFVYSTVSKEAIDALPALKFVTTRSTGFDHVDVAYCRSKGIPVATVPEYGSNTVAEHTFALILSLTRKIYQSVNQAKTLNFEHPEIRGIDLFGKTIGIIGLGKIGSNVVRIAKGFGMNVIVTNRSQDASLAARLEFRYEPLETLLRQSDIVSLHLPYLPATHHTINMENIKLMKKGSYLVNTARGGLIDTEAIVVGLNEGILEGVGLDVLEEEKELSEETAILTQSWKKDVNLKNLVFNHMLMNHPKVLITPHNAFNSIEALMRIIETTEQNIGAYVDGKELNLVPPPSA
jgi:D-lactate dehydrogenase